MHINIPAELAIKSIEIRWKFIAKNTTIPINKVFNSCFNNFKFYWSRSFKFDEKIFKQVFDMPVYTGYI